MIEKKAEFYVDVINESTANVRYFGAIFTVTITEDNHLISPVRFSKMNFGRLKAAVLTKMSMIEQGDFNNEHTRE